jgi:hypothetical protein
VILPESAYGAQEKAPPSLGRATGATAHASPWLSSFESDVVTADRRDTAELLRRQPRENSLFVFFLKLPSKFWAEQDVQTNFPPHMALISRGRERGIAAEPRRVDPYPRFDTAAGLFCDNHENTEKKQ